MSKEESSTVYEEEEQEVGKSLDEIHHPTNSDLERYYSRYKDDSEFNIEYFP